MNTTEINALLERFYKGEASESEEVTLKEFFRSGNIPPGLADHKELFLFYHSSAEEGMEEKGFEEKISEMITQPRQPVITMHSRRRIIFYVGSMAASVLLLIGMVFLFITEKPVPADESAILTEEQHQIYSQAHDILTLVSVNLNKGIEKAAYIGKFDDAMQKMDMLSKYYQYQSIIINPDQLEGSAKNK